jgi:hypothetical protein
MEWGGGRASRRLLPCPEWLRVIAKGGTSRGYGGPMAETDDSFYSDEDVGAICLAIFCN